MINNPLLNAEVANPVCPTGWHELQLPRSGYKGHDELTLRAANVLRVWTAPETDPRVVARLYTPDGEVAGLYTDRMERKMLPEVDQFGKLMADAPGVELLKGRLPWAKEPVELAKDTLLGAMGLKHYPFSALSHVLVTAYMPSDLMEAMVRAYRLDAMLKYGGLPVLAVTDRPPDGVDLCALEQVRWPPGITLLATSERLADQVADVLFEVEVDVFQV